MSWGCVLWIGVDGYTYGAVCAWQQEMRGLQGVPSYEVEWKMVTLGGDCRVRLCSDQGDGGVMQQQLLCRVRVHEGLQRLLDEQ